MKIIFFGDSIIEGRYGVSFLDRVEEDLKNSEVEIINKGQMGDTSHNLVDRVERDVLSIKPQYVFLHIGINDLMCYLSKKESERMDKWPIDISPTLFKKNVNNLVSRMVAEKIKVVIILPGGIEGNHNVAKNDCLEEYIESLISVAQDFDLPFIDWRNKFSQSISRNNKSFYSEVTLSSIVIDMKEIFMKFPPTKVKRDKTLRKEYYQYIDQMAQKRGLHLTFDGIHFTYSGVESFSKYIVNFIRENIM